MAAIKAQSGGADVHLALGDLSRLADVARLAAELVERFPRIDVLINNAGMMANERRLSEDGFELDFAVNVVAPLELTERLLPALEAARPARVINVSGGASGKTLDVDDLDARRGFVGVPTYANTKRAMEAAALARAPALAERGVFLNIVYPGNASTAMTRAMRPSSMPWWARPGWPLFRLLRLREDGGRSAARASRSSVWAATAPELEGRHSLYYDTDCRPAELPADVRDPRKQERVLAYISAARASP